MIIPESSNILFSTQKNNNKSKKKTCLILIKPTLQTLVIINPIPISVYKV